MSRVSLVRAMLAILLIGGGCATPGVDHPSAFRGSDGPVAWQVIDVGQVVSLDGSRTLWSYVVVLRNTTGASVQFERRECGSYTPGRDIIGGTPTSTPFRRSLAANSELRVPLTRNFGWIRQTPFGGAATLQTLTVECRFIGVDAQGTPVSVLVRLRLDRSVGRRTTPPPTTGPLPAVRSLTAADLASLAGTWRGSYRTTHGGNDFDIPLEATIGTDGSVDFGEYDPVTRRFRGSLAVRDGRLEYRSGRDSGTLELHEGGDKRVLFGRASGPRDGTTTSYLVRLEAPTTR